MGAKRSRNKQPTLETELLFKPFNMGAVMVITAITRVMFEEQTSLSRSITGKTRLHR